MSAQPIAQFPTPQPSRNSARVLRGKSARSRQGDRRTRQPAAIDLMSAQQSDRARLHRDLERLREGHKVRQIFAQNSIL